MIIRGGTLIKVFQALFPSDCTCDQNMYGRKYLHVFLIKLLIIRGGTLIKIYILQPLFPKIFAYPKYGNILI